MTDAGNAGPEAGAQVCIDCLRSYPLTMEYWPVRGASMGKRCRVCAREAKRKFDEQDKQRKAAADATAKASTFVPTSETAVMTQGAVAEGAEVALPLRQTAITKALREGVRFMNAEAPTVLATLFVYIADPTHPHHEWAIKFVAERLLPRKMFESLGAKAAGIDVESGGNKPLVTIIVQPATIPQPGEPPSVKVIEGEVVREDEPEEDDERSEA